MQIGKKNLTRAKHRAFVSLGLFYFDNHFRAGEDFLGVTDDLGTCGLIFIVTRTDAFPGISLHHDLVTMGNGFAHAGRRHADPVFVVLYFLGDADQHCLFSDFIK